MLFPKIPKHSAWLFLLVLFGFQTFFGNPVHAQTDPLISKSIPLILADEKNFWAISGDASHCSIIDPFTNPVSIKNDSLPFSGALRGGVGRKNSILVFGVYNKSDTEKVRLPVT